jgi:iron complex transport system substrate-binding protein
LTEETTETLYLLGEGERIVGISGYTVRPPEARRKPKVCAFINAKFDKICELKPDLVVAFSDLQADIVRELVKRGLNVVTFNQRSVSEILQTIRATGALVGCADKAEQLVQTLISDLESASLEAKSFARRPKVFFEEWHEPLISGIRWVEELIEIAGGEPIFPELRIQSLAKDRIVDPAEVARRNPDLVIASWCGRKVSFDKIRARPGWSAVRAVQSGMLREIKSTYILQPGPASLTEGLRQLREHIREAARLMESDRRSNKPERRI